MSKKTVISYVFLSFRTNISARTRSKSQHEPLLFIVAGLVLPEKLRVASIVVRIAPWGERNRKRKEQTK